MKPLLFNQVKLAIAFILTFNINNFSQAQDCGAQIPPGHYEHLQRLIQSIDQDQQKTAQSYSLPVQFIVSRNNSGGNSALTTAEKTVAMSEINTAYAPMNISFYEHASPVYIDNTTWNNSFDYGNDASLAPYEVSNVINIFVFHTVTSGTSSICGYAKFPGTGNRVILNSSCTQNGSSTAHELGHYFSLLHTHETFYGAELVQRTNCTSAGDLFCDTPADPNVSGQVTGSCVYVGSATDANGDTYAPDPNNVMSYSVKSCRTDFSNDQQGAIVASLTSDRSYLLPVSDITSFPYEEGFESGFGNWSNESGDNIDWSRNSGTTPSSNTGPSSASAGNYYMFTESSGNGTGYPTKTAIFQSTDVVLGSLSNPEITFDYHMYGASMGTLQLQLSTNGGSSWSTLWTLSGDQGNSWTTATVSLSAYAGQTFKLRFYGTTGSSWQSDMSIDQIRIQSAGGAPVCNGINSFPYFEGFESGLGDWSNESGDNLNWTRDANGTPSVNTGPSSAFSGTYYMYVESSGSGSGYPNKTAHLVSDCIDLNNLVTPYFSFIYHMYGASMGTLEVQVSTNDGVSWTNLWTRNGDLGNTWYQANISMATYQGQVVKMRFLATTGSSWQSDLTIDRVQIGNNAIDEVENSLIPNVVNDFEFEVYPNPTSDPVITLDISSPIEGSKARLEMTNINGQKVMIESFGVYKGQNKRQITVDHLAKGIYQLALIFDHEKVVTKKIVVK